MNERFFNLRKDLFQGHFTRENVNSGRIGLSADWRRVGDWLYFNFIGPIDICGMENVQTKESKGPEIPILQDYSSAPDPCFCKSFLYRPLPVKPGLHSETGFIGMDRNFVCLWRRHN